MRIWNEKGMQQEAPPCTTVSRVQKCLKLLFAEARGCTVFSPPPPPLSFCSLVCVCVCVWHPYIPTLPLFVKATARMQIRAVRDACTPVWKIPLAPIPWGCPTKADVALINEWASPTLINRFDLRLSLYNVIYLRTNYLESFKMEK